MAGGDLPAAHARPRDRDLGLLRLDHQRNPGAVLPSRVKEIGITGSFFMSPSAWRRLCSCAGRPKRGAVSLDALEEGVTTGEIYIGMR